MKRLILAAVVAAVAGPVLAQVDTTYKPLPPGGNAALHSMGCAGSAIAGLFDGDFSKWVLPSFFGGNHMRAGQYIVPMVNEKGNRRCTVGGHPNGPLS